MTSKYIEDLASDFWECVGSPEPFPRGLEHSIRCAKPVDIAHLPDLCPSAIGHWLRRHGYQFPLQTQERWLNGCLLVFRGMGFVFVEAGLDAAEARMIVAHEFGHCLAEYDGPRERARRRLGPHVLTIFDGERPPTDQQKFRAALAGVELGVHVHYMERKPDSTFPEYVGQVERTANELAFELIAPWRTVFAALQAQGPLPTDAGRWLEVLQRRFGLPASWAQPYAERLSALARKRRTFSEILGF